MGLSAAFAEIYEQNAWGAAESRTGSTFSAFGVVRAEPPGLSKTTASRLCHMPCGDFNWMNLLNLGVDYIGTDIVGELIAENRGRFGGEGLGVRGGVSRCYTSRPTSCREPIWSSAVIAPQL
jgi:hypothetical protein